MITALSLWQPWATLIAIGAKRWETRSWYMSHLRRPLAIHAAKRMDEDSLELCLDEPFNSALVGAGIQQIADLPFGAVVCLVTPEFCLKTEDAMAHGLIDKTEFQFGDFSPGRYCTRMKVEKYFTPPLLATGRQGFWEWDEAETPWRRPDTPTRSTQKELF